MSDAYGLLGAAAVCAAIGVTRLLDSVRGCAVSASMRPEQHGTHYGYAHHGCRCGRCREANRAQQARGNADRARRLAADPSLAAHGSASTYANWKCRCEPCSKAHAAKWVEYAAQRKAGSRL